MNVVLLIHGIVTGCAVAACAVLVAFRLLVDARYRRRWRASPAGFAPTVAVFVPFRGVDHDTAGNARAVLSLARPSREFFFVVESEADPAWQLLSRTVAGRPDARVVVAGRARSCAQKIHNLLAGIEASAGRGDVLVFIDSDLCVDPAYLDRLLVPLSDPRVAATSGGAWVVPARNTLAEALHAFWFSLIRLFSSFPFFRVVAGCATAIRRSEFEALGVADAWRTVISDDMVLTRILGAAGSTVVYVPGCLALLHGGEHILRRILAWIRRQAQMAKYGSVPMWMAAGVGFGIVVANVIAVPVLAVLAAVLPAAVPLLVQAAVGAALFWFGAILLRTGVDDGQPLAPWVLRMPLLIVLAYGGLISSAFGSTVRWGGLEYRMGRGGRIRSISHHRPAGPRRAPRGPPVRVTTGTASPRGGAGS